LNSGDLATITRTVSVTGPGAGSLTIDRGNTNFPLAAFSVGDGGTLTLGGVTVTGAYSGISLVTGGSATVTNSTLSNNTNALNFSGAGGSATVTGSTLSTNGTGLRFASGGSATVTNSTLSGNTTAGLYLFGGGVATVTNTTLSGNAAGL